MAYKTSRITKAHPIPEDIQASRKWGSGFSREHGFAIQIHKKYWMSIFVHSDLLSAKAAERRAFVDREGVIAHCISCVGEDWEVRSEPIDKAKAGLIVYTAKGKAIGRGIIFLNKVGEPEFTSESLYPGITNAVKLEYKLEGKAKNNGWEVTASVTVSDSR